MGKGLILSLIEHRNDSIRDVSWETLGAAKKLCSQADLEMAAVVLGYDCDDLVTRVSAHVNPLYYLQSEQLKYYICDRYCIALETLIKEVKPMIMLLPHTAQGMELGATLAARLKIPYLPDCIDLLFQEGYWVGIREIFTGKVKGEFQAARSNTVIVSLRPGIFKSISTQKIKEKKILESSVNFKTNMFLTEFLNLVEPEKSDIDITKSDVIVSVGRGIGDKEKIPLFEELADVLGGTLAATRPVIDIGWLPKERQVGQSGKTVKPKLYFAFGISGAYQHILGMKNAQTIIAINKDPRAPIFNVADFGIVGDMFEVTRPLIEKVKLRASA
jgi:electron transfer flavoprotein alpha subunit